MKWIRHGKSYDTTTALELFRTDVDERGEISEQTLYRSPRGQLFLTVNDEEMTLLDAYDATEWLGRVDAPEEAYRNGELEIEEG